MHHRHTLCALLTFTLMLSTNPLAQSGAVVLRNGTLEANLASGRIESITYLATGQRIAFADDHFTLVVNGQTVLSRSDPV